MKTPFKMKTPLYRASSPLNNNSTGRYPKTHGEMGEKELKDHGMVNHTAPSPKAKKDKPKATRIAHSCHKVGIDNKKSKLKLFLINSNLFIIFLQ